MSKFENCTIMLPNPIYHLKGYVLHHIDRYTGYVLFEFLFANRNSRSQMSKIYLFLCNKANAQVT